MKPPRVGDAVVRVPDGRGCGATAWLEGSIGTVIGVRGASMDVRPDEPDWHQPTHVSVFTRDGWRHATEEELAKRNAIADASEALRAATEAVAKARDAVVEAARAAAGRWGATPWVPYDEGDSGDITDAVRRLEEAERAEAEARARLEALR